MIEKHFTAEEILEAYPDATDFSIFLESATGTYRWMESEFQRVSEGSHTITYNSAKHKANKIGLNGVVEIMAFKKVMR